MADSIKPTGSLPSKSNVATSSIFSQQITSSKFSQSKGSLHTRRSAQTATDTAFQLKSSHFTSILHQTTKSNAVSYTVALSTPSAHLNSSVLQTGHRVYQEDVAVIICLLTICGISAILLILLIINVIVSFLGSLHILYLSC